MKHSRHEFTPSTKRILAERVAYRCSNPACRASTIGPSTESEKSTLLGEAAHISAAAPGGARYDRSLSEDARRHYQNGIWLCRPCAKLIDAEDSEFAVGQLQEWKATAEASAREALTPSHVVASPFATVSKAARFGFQSCVLVDGEPVDCVTIIKPDDSGNLGNTGYTNPAWFLDAYVHRFKVLPHADYVMVDEITVTVHDWQPIPPHQVLYGLYPAEASLYLVTVDRPTVPDQRFSATRFYEKSESGTTIARQIAPLVIDDDLPATVFVRVNAKTAGLYNLSIDVVVSHGLNQAKHVILANQSVIFMEPEFTITNDEQFGTIIS